MRIAGQSIEVWVITTLCGVVVTLFTLWRTTETSLYEQQKACAEQQRLCDADKLAASQSELANLKSFYEQIKKDQDAQIAKLKRAKK